MVSSADSEDDHETTNYPSSLSRDDINVNANIDSRSFSFASNSNSNSNSFLASASASASISISTARGRGRSLDFGLNRSLRHLDTRYVEDSENENENEASLDRKHNGEQEYNTYNNNHNHSNPSSGHNEHPNHNNHNYNPNRKNSFHSDNNIHHSESSSNDNENDNDNDSNNDSNNSGYLSRTEPFDDASWSLATGSQDESRTTAATNAAATVASHYAYDGDNASVNENDSDDPRLALFHLLDLHCSVYPSDDEDNDAPPKVARNDWEPIREWLEAMMTTTTTMSSGREQDGDLDDLDEIENVIVADDPHKETKDRLLRAAVLEARGRSGQTVLHVACERSVPIDVLELLLSVVEPTSSVSGENANLNVNVNINDNINNSGKSSLALCSTIDGWLPLHYACNYPNEHAVVERLAEAFPEAKTHADLKGRTPLHFAMREENMNRPEVVALLACAAGIADDNGILPLHYACLYGATEDFLRILTEAHPGGVASRDRFGRVPLHYSLSNAGKPNAPAAVRLLLASEPNLVNTPGIARVFSGSDAVRKYAVSAKEHKYRGFYDESRGGFSARKRLSDGVFGRPGGATTEVFSSEAVEECLKRFLEAKPNPTADFFTALQSLPESLREKAVLMRVVQELLNKKIGQRFPTALLLLDLYLQMIVAVCYTLAIRDSITWRFRDYEDGVDASLLKHTTEQVLCLLGLYMALVYFLFREIIQIIGLVSLKASWIWVYEPGNWLNVTYIAVIGIWTILATSGKGDRDVFRNGAALSFAILWLKFLSYLRKILIDFSVFSGGVFHVLRRLLAFLMCLTIILIAFSRMFFALFYETEYCKASTKATTKATATPSSAWLGTDFGAGANSSILAFSSPVDDEAFTKDLICEANGTDFPWCNAWDSFLAVYTMLLGEVDETVFGDNTTALVLFVIFVLLVVILLANVLIAIVTDSYKVIRDNRAAIVFWTNRLDFIAQIDAIASGPWKSRLKGLLGLQKEDTSFDKNNSYQYFEATFGKALWNDIVELFEHEMLVEDGIFTLDFVLCMILRMVALLLVPLWILAGALSAGLLWPPQIRERLFVSAIINHNSKSEQEETLRKTQIENLRGEIAQLKNDLVMESSQQRTQIVQMKSAVAERKLETLNTLTTIKKNVVLALELCEIGREG